jgi:hypothetical protein
MQIIQQLIVQFTLSMFSAISMVALEWESKTDINA